MSGGSRLFRMVTEWRSRRERPRRNPRMKSSTTKSAREEDRMSDKIAYSVVEGWEQLPKGYVHRDVAGVAVDGEDRVYLICRGDHPVIIYDREGNFKRSWGEGEFSYRTHGIYVGPNGTIFCTDDGQHTVRQFTPDGKLLMTMGVLNTPSDSGYDGKNLDSIKRGAGPFNRPTNVAIGPKGDIYISDGYGNSRVHVFSPKGELKRSWGEPGSGPGQFHLPHGIAVAQDGRVFVCDKIGRASCRESVE